MVNIGDLVGTLQIRGGKEAQETIGRFQAAIGTLGNAMTRVGGVVGSFGNVMTAGFSGFATGGPIGAAIGAGIAGLTELSKAMQWAVGEATDSEQAFKNLAEAVKRSGTAWTDVEARTRSYLSQLQKTTVYSDEALAGMIERLLTFGMTYEQAMSAAGTALDLAAAKHMDLQSASDLLGKAFMGNTALLKRYGIDIEEAGGKSAKFTDILALLNQQFGGSAQEQAKTYAGIQERLKNATSELGEKIGGMVLPALAGMTEAMIPVVDALGEGVTAVQNWLTEVGKMPEVQAVVAVVNEAFSGFRSYLQDLWSFMQTSFGPALQELWQAFKELWDALAPIGEAFGELFAAMSGGEGDFDLLKTLIQGIVLEIRGIAEIIKAVAPYIRMFADTFKEAADFIAPILAQMTSAIRGFLDGLKTAFQAFYNWLVGGSLWTDLWNTMLTIASQMISRLLNDLAAKLFQPMQTAFTNAMQAVGDLWNRSWTSVQTFLSTQLAAMITALQTSTSQYSPTMSAALTAVQNSMNMIFSLIKGDWSGALSFLQTALTQWGQFVQTIMSGIMTALQGIVSQGVAAMIAAFNNLVASAQSAVAQAQALFSQAQQTAASAAQQLAQAAQPATNAITNAFDQAYNTVANGAQWLWNTLTGHSIWTDMLADMQGQTEASLSEIMSSFQGAFDNVALSVPAAPGASRASLAEPVSVSLGSQSITIPITVTLDGQVISRQVEQRIVERVNLRGKKVA